LGLVLVTLTLVVSPDPTLTVFEFILKKYTHKNVSKTHGLIKKKKSLKFNEAKNN
jgi:hypothetical protein